MLGLVDTYKQIPLSDQAFERDAYLAVYDPTSEKAAMFKQRVLPFGSIASVAGFLESFIGFVARREQPS